MRNAKLAMAAAALSCVMGNPAVMAADDASGSQSKLNVSETAVQANQSDEASPFANMAQQSMGDMMGMAGMLMGEMPPPDKRKSFRKDDSRDSEPVALAGVPDGTPNLEAHMGMGETGMGPGMCFPGKGMPGGHMMKGHGMCPLMKLEGANALTDDQYQKLYDIKGQFISNIVPKGLNTYMLIRKMQNALTAAEPDSGTVRDLERQIAAATSDISMTVMDAIVSADQVLTPDQRKELHRQLIRH